MLDTLRAAMLGEHQGNPYSKIMVTRLSLIGKVSTVNEHYL